MRFLSSFSTARIAALSALLTTALLFGAETKAKKPSTFDVVPKVTKQEEPVYPMAMRRYGISGDVTVDLIVGTNGRVQSAVVYESDSPGFDEAAVEAVLKWQFKPALKDGKPVPAKMRVPILFKLDDWSERRAFEIQTNGDPSKLPADLRFDTAPEMKSVHLPVYPYALRRDKVQGKARAGIVIAPSGRVANVHVLEASHPEFGRALQASLEGFRFVPAKLHGQPVQSIMTFSQDFNGLTPVDSPGDDMLSLEKRSPEKILQLTDLDAPLQPRSRRAPRFPFDVPEGVVAGEAIIECLIDRTGRVRLPRIKSATHESFGYAAVQAATSWWFDPPLVKGKPAVVRAQIPFVFTPPAPKKAPAKKQ